MDKTTSKGGPRAYRINDLVAFGWGSRATLHRQIAAGRLKALKLGRRTIITAEALERYCKDLPDARNPRKR